jgi:uncharacterized protein (TIGR00266 family)
MNDTFLYIPPERSEKKKKLVPEIKEEEENTSEPKQLTGDFKAIRSFANKGLDYDITGRDIQLLTIKLKSGEYIIAEAGAMTYLTQEIDFTATLSDGVEDTKLLSKLFKAGKRKLTGEKLFLTKFTNKAEQTGHVAFSAPFPGQIVPIDLKDYSEEFICQKRAFLCATKNTEISLEFTKKLSAGFFGGEGFILQKLKGKGVAFIHAGGSIIEKKLIDERILVETGSLVGFSSGLTYNVKPINNFFTMMFGGEGCFLTSLTGTGSVFIQSLPFNKVCQQIFDHLPSQITNTQT